MPAFDDEEALACAREQNDMEIGILLESVRALKTRRNTLSLISRLSPEILSRNIRFRLCQLRPEKFQHCLDLINIPRLPTLEKCSPGVSQSMGPHLSR